MPNPLPPIEPGRDLVLEREVDVPPHLLWAAWTRPEHVKHWFAPAPWSITECQIDLRPGGAFSFVMRSPEGELSPNDACYLEVVPNQRLVWTDALKPGFRPSENPFMTAAITLEPRGNGTLYRAVAYHRDASVRDEHEAMGFFEGWGQVLDQLVQYAKTKM
jgi:uncharacterized protein YndB with AHSA1/START domain